MSRTLGDPDYKLVSRGKVTTNQIIVSEPDIHCLKLTPQDEFFIIASDGFWFDCVGLCPYLCPSLACLSCLTLSISLYDPLFLFSLSLLSLSLSLFLSFFFLSLSLRVCACMCRRCLCLFCGFLGGKGGRAGNCETVNSSICVTLCLPCVRLRLFFY